MGTFTFTLPRVKGTCLVAANVILSRWEANHAPPNLLAGFEGTLQGGGKRGKMEGRKGWTK